MKKLLFTIMMLCSIAAASAAGPATGSGAEDNPYKGEWYIPDLTEVIMRGDHLAYDCYLKNGYYITVIDTKLDVKLADHQLSLYVGDPLRETPWSQYAEYSAYNSFEQRLEQTFIVTDLKYVERSPTFPELTIYGHYSGNYDRGDGTPQKPYASEWQVSELATLLKPGDCLAYDCVIEGGKVTVNDTKLGNTAVVTAQTSWTVGDAIDATPYSDYSTYCQHNTPLQRKHQQFVLTAVSHDGDELTLTGYYSGLYDLARDAEGYYLVATAQDLKSVIQSDNAAKVRLADNVNVAGIGTLCGTFRGIIDGACQVWDQDSLAYVEGSHSLTGGRREGIIDSPLFDNVEDAVIKNVTFRSFRIEEESNDNFGLVARTASNTKFTSLGFDHVSLFQDKDNAGIVVGKATNKCEFLGVITNSCDVTIDGRNAGGIVGYSEECSYATCVTLFTSSVYADGRTWGVIGFDPGLEANAGGIVGRSKKDQFLGCMNFGLVGALQNGVGGIVGRCGMDETIYGERDEGSVFIGCTNSGLALQCEAERKNKDDEGVYFDVLRREMRDKFENLSFEDISRVSHAMDVLGNTTTVVALGTALLKIVAGVDMYGSIQSYLFFKGMTTIFHTGDTGVAVAEQASLLSDATAVAASVTTAVLLEVIAISVATYLILTDYDELGGICGCSHDSRFESCANYADLKNDDDFGGGIVGKCFSTTVNNCLNTGTVHNDGADSNGSIVGWAQSSKITNCLSTVAMPILGVAYEPVGSPIDPASGNNYRIQGGEKEGASQYEMQVSAGQLATGIVMHWLNNGYENRKNNVKPWIQKLHGENNNMHPVLGNAEDQDPNDDMIFDVIITEPGQLVAFAERVNSGTGRNQFATAALGNDIDMSEVEGFTPIGQNKSYSQFRGIFDGRGHTIKGLKVNREGEAGLFGSVHIGAEIRNVIIADDCEFVSTGNVGVGGIVGQVVATDWKWGNVVIDNCANYGTVTATKTANAGGILGLVKNDTKDNVHVYVDNCYNMGTVTAENGNSALLCGYMRNSGVVSNSWSAGQLRTSNDDVKPYDDSQGQGHAEFFVGYWEKLDITNCFVVEKLENVDGTFMLTRQDGVEDHSAEGLTSGALCYKLNNGVVDGSQTWYQTIGADDYPVRTKLTDGTNIVFRYKDANSITHYGNTSREEISDVILGNKTFDEHRITDMNDSGDVDVADVMLFNAAAIR